MDEASEHYIKFLEAREGCRRKYTIRLLGRKAAFKTDDQGRPI
jgi:hypothetical protein